MISVKYIIFRNNSKGLIVNNTVRIVKAEGADLQYSDIHKYAVNTTEKGYGFETTATILFPAVKSQFLSLYLFFEWFHFPFG
jgi:hypothetical protein